MEDLIGKRVYHPDFGIGIIESVVPWTDASIINISFEEAIEGKKYREFTLDTLYSHFSFDKLEDYKRKDDLHQSNPPTLEDPSNSPAKNDILSHAAESISKLLNGYRFGEIEPISPTIVKTWIEQFTFLTDEEKVKFAQGIEDIFSKYYFTKDRIELDIREFLQDQGVFSKNPGDYLHSATLISKKQKYGESHQVFVDIFKATIKDLYGFKIGSEGEANFYIYVDDCLFSGNRIIEEMKGLLETANLRDCKLVIYYHAVHLDSIEYVYNNLTNLFKDRNVLFTLNYSVGIDNRRSTESKIECIWPRNDENQITSDWESHLKLTRSEKNPTRKTIYCFSDTPKEEFVFRFKEIREVVDRSLLRAGIQILLNVYSEKRIFSPNGIPIEVDKNEFCIKPLGFDKMKGLGFGSIYFNYRNVANNCPVAFWYDGSDDENVWNPLLLRKSDNPNSWWR